MLDIPYFPSDPLPFQMNQENQKFFQNINLDLNPENESHHIEESKESNNSSLLSISEKKLSYKRRKAPETGINLAIKELQARWKEIFEFDMNEPLKVKGKKKKLTKKGLIDFFSDLQTTMSQHGVTSLNKLSLDLSGYSALIEGGLMALSEALETTFFKDLRYFHLNLNDANVSDQEIQQLLTQIANHLPFLESFSLNFNGCYKIQFQTFEDIHTKFLLKLPNLTSLSLKMNLPKNTSSSNNDYVSNLLTCITDNLKNLQSLDLDLSGYHIHPRNLNDIVHQLTEKLPKLTSFNLVLNGSRHTIDHSR